MKKNTIATLLLACLLTLGVTASAVDYTKVADASDMTTVETVGVAGMTPVSAADVADGVYEVEVESSSSMFRITKAVLTVENGTMTADLTLSGTGYPVLYPGTGTEAAQDTEDHYIGYREGEDGAYTYTLPVPTLDQPFPCAAFSRNKEQWYDRSLLVRADSLPEGAVLVELPDYAALEKAARDARIEAMKTPEGAASTPSAIDLPDGTYSVSVVMEGGSGRASVLTPAPLTVTDGKAVARLEWSSPHYDYMLVDGVRYAPVNSGGNSVFEVPVNALEVPLTMVADTTAMSVPHEITYTFTFSPADAPDPVTNTRGLIPVLAAAACMVVLGFALGRKERTP